MHWLTAVLGVAAGLALLYFALLILLWRTSRQGSPATLTDALRLLPDLIHLLRRLAGDSSLPRGVRIRLGLLLVYLASPIDIVPDFLPVIGYADDAVIVAIALRSVARHAGRDAIERHWPGSRDGLLLLYQLAGLKQT
jgi:uncharacterized membrane protein YkvA (DUF1232 family)